MNKKMLIFYFCYQMISLEEYLKFLQWLCAVVEKYDFADALQTLANEARGKSIFCAEDLIDYVGDGVAMQEVRIFFAEKPSGLLNALLLEIKPELLEMIIFFKKFPAFNLANIVWAWSEGCMTAEQVYKGIPDRGVESPLNESEKTILHWRNHLLPKSCEKMLDVANFIKNIGLVTYCGGSVARREQNNTVLNLAMVRRDFIDDVPNVERLLRAKGILLDVVKSTSSELHVILTLYGEAFYVEITLVSAEYFTPVAAMHFIGPRRFISHVATVARSKGLRLTEKSLEIAAYNQTINIANEFDIFRVLGMNYVPPHMRALMA